MASLTESLICWSRRCTLSASSATVRNWLARPATASGSPGTGLPPTRSQSSAGITTGSASGVRRFGDAGLVLLVLLDRALQLVDDFVDLAQDLLPPVLPAVDEVLEPVDGARASEPAVETFDRAHRVA